MLRSLKRGPRLTRRQRVDYAKALFEKVTGRELRYDPLSLRPAH
jgi:hypothetical protein